MTVEGSFRTESEVFPNFPNFPNNFRILATTCCRGFFMLVPLHPIKVKDKIIRHENISVSKGDGKVEGSFPRLHSSRSLQGFAL